VDAHVNVIDDVGDEPTAVQDRTERRLVNIPCVPCRCSGEVTVLREGKTDERVCPLCRGLGFHRTAVPS
jgi:hypothetical protein